MADATDSRRISSVKRLIGRSKKEAQKAGEDLTWHGVGAGSHHQAIALPCAANGKGTVSPEEVSAEVLRRLLREAREAMGGVEIPRAVVTVPAYFSNAQCQATTRAAELAGLERVRLLKEPEAAALAYGIDRQDDELVLVFDLGGGTFDVSILEVGGGVIEVIATSGDAHLGGDDFDAAIAEWMGSEATKAVRALQEQRSGEAGGPRGGRMTLCLDSRRRLREAAEVLKRRLSGDNNVEVVVDGLAELDGRPLELTMSQSQLASVCAELLQRMMRPVREVALMANVLLPGDVGSGAMGQILREAEANEQKTLDQDQRGPTAESLSELSGSALSALKKQQQQGRKGFKDQRKRMKRERLEFADAARRFGEEQRGGRKATGKGGRSKQAGATGGSASSKGTKLLHFPAGRALTEVILVGGATRMPCVQELVRIMFGLEPRRTVDPDEAVALGAAIQAGIMDGTVDGLDVYSPIQAAFLRAMHRRKITVDPATGVLLENGERFDKAAPESAGV